jgi:hypothetical protein
MLAGTDWVKAANMAQQQTLHTRLHKNDRLRAQQRRSFVIGLWWSDGDSNPGPSACKADALPTELPPLKTVMSYEF